MLNKISKKTSDESTNETSNQCLTNALREKLNNDLDEAITNMDTPRIEQLLSELEGLTASCTPLEDSKLFAKRIIKKKNKQLLKGYDFMKKINKKYGTLIASAALVLVASTGVLYATGILSQITIFRDDATYTISSDLPLTEQDANAAIDALEIEQPSSEEEAENTALVKQTFDSINDVSKAFDVPIILPTVLPENFSFSNDIQTESYELIKGHTNANIYISFDNPTTTEETIKNRTAKLFQISIIKNDNTGISQSISKSDAVYADTYTNALGDTYTILNEDGALIAHITLGNIEYNLCFFNISTDEMHNIMDHTNLSAYKNLNK